MKKINLLIMAVIVIAVSACSIKDGELVGDYTNFSYNSTNIKRLIENSKVIYADSKYIVHEIQADFVNGAQNAKSSN